MELSKLSYPKGAKKHARRVGRGESSGAGKTSGRGGKGQTARTGGKVRPGFEGGQMPLYRRLPKFGFTSLQQIKGVNSFEVFNFDFLEKFENGAVVDKASLGEMRGKTFGPKAKIKILAKGKLTKKLKVKVDGISESARQKIESLGGTIELINSKPLSTGKRSKRQARVEQAK